MIVSLMSNTTYQMGICPMGAMRNSNTVGTKSGYWRESMTAWNVMGVFVYLLV